MCAWAATVSAGAWAMIAGLFATTAVNFIGSHMLVPDYRNRFAWDREAADALFRFGRWVLLSTMITFCAMQVDRLLLGRLITKEMLGVYSVALAVAMLPNMLLQTLGGAVIYPLMARMARRDRSELAEKLATARDVLSALAIFFVVGVVLEAPAFFELLYDARYASAGRIAQLLAMTVWISALATTLERVPQALGETRMLAAYNLVKLVAASVASLVGYHFGGLEGFILGYTIGVGIGNFALHRMLRVWHRRLAR
ncbi:MAG: oligosaccharide flippase family protein [Pirellulales bacterium]